jgi:hypothetical protein
MHRRKGVFEGVDVGERGKESKKIKGKRKKKLDGIPRFYQVTFANMAADHGHFKWENVRAR